MDVSIIIVNYNTKELILNCIQSIYEKTIGIDYEIIVVDNASVDGSQNMVMDIFKDVKLIYLKENIGFGRANNEGVKIATGKNILFLNSDTILLNNAIKTLSDFLNNNAKIGACGGNLYDENLKPTHSYRRIFPSVLYELNYLLDRVPEKILFGRNSEHNYSNKTISVAYVTGADLMIKRTVIEKIGCFLDVFFMYFEETDLCLRIKKAGFQVFSVPEARIQHLECKSFNNETVNIKRISLSEASRQIYYTINYSKVYREIANYIYNTNILFRTYILKLIKSQSFFFWETTLKEFRKVTDRKYA